MSSDAGAAPDWMREDPELGGPMGEAMRRGLQVAALGTLTHPVAQRRGELAAEVGESARTLMFTEDGLESFGPHLLDAVRAVDAATADPDAPPTAIEFPDQAGFDGFFAGRGGTHVWRYAGPPGEPRAPEASDGLVPGDRRVPANRVEVELRRNCLAAVDSDRRRAVLVDALRRAGHPVLVSLSRFAGARAVTDVDRLDADVLSRIARAISPNGTTETATPAPVALAAAARYEWITAVHHLQRRFPHHAARLVTITMWLTMCT